MAKFDMNAMLKQHLTPTQFVGAGLVVAAIVTMQLRLRPRGEALASPARAA